MSPRRWRRRMSTHPRWWQETRTGPDIRVTRALMHIAEVNRDGADLRGLGTDVSLVRHARTFSALTWAGTVRFTPADNVDVHGPAARSLTNAAISSGVSKNKVLLNSCLLHGGLVD